MFIAGVLKGDGKLSYDDAYAAGSAVEIFNNKEFEGMSRGVARCCLTAQRCLFHQQLARFTVSPR
jgi:hypothetical protein